MARSGGGVYSLPAGSLVTDGVDDVLASQHNTPLQDIASDLNVARPIVAGGTGATTAVDALVNLGLTATAAELNLMDGFSAVETTATDVTTAFPNSRALIRGRGPTWFTALATTSGTAFDFTGIPTWATEILVQFFAVSLSGTDHLGVQLGTSGGIVATGYVGSSGAISGATTSSINGTGAFVLLSGDATYAASGEMRISAVGSDRWVQSHAAHLSANIVTHGGGSITLPGALDRIRVTRTGANTFDLGAVRVGYR